MTDRNDRPTDPAPAGNVDAEITELLGAVREVSRVAVKLETTLLRVQLAQRTLEHRANIERQKRIADRRWLVDLEQRVRELESPAPVAAE
jgi:hypothetical protein